MRRHANGANGTGNPPISVYSRSLAVQNQFKHYCTQRGTLYHNLRVSSRDAKILARGESPVSGGESTPGKVSKGDSVTRGLYILVAAPARCAKKGQVAPQLMPLVIPAQTAPAKNGRVLDWELDLRRTPGNASDRSWPPVGYRPSPGFWEPDRTTGQGRKAVRPRKSCKRPPRRNLHVNYLGCSHLRPPCRDITLSVQAADNLEKKFRNIGPACRITAELLSDHGYWSVIA